MRSTLHILFGLAATLALSAHAKEVAREQSRPQGYVTTTTSYAPASAVTSKSKIFVQIREDPRADRPPGDSRGNNDPPQMPNNLANAQAAPAPPAGPLAPVSTVNCASSVATAAAQAQSSASSAVESAISSANASVAAATAQAQSSVSVAIESAVQSANAGILNANSSAAAAATAASASASSAIASLSADAARLISSAQAAASAAAGNASIAVQQASIAAAAATGSLGIAASSLLPVVQVSTITIQQQATVSLVPATSVQALADSQASSASQTIITLQREIRGSWSPRQAAIAIVLSAIISSLITVVIYIFMARCLAKRSQGKETQDYAEREGDNYPSDIKSKAFPHSEMIVIGKEADSMTSTMDGTLRSEAYRQAESQQSLHDNISPLRRNTYIARPMTPKSMDIENIPDLPSSMPEANFNFFGTDTTSPPRKVDERNG